MEKIFFLGLVFGAVVLETISDVAFKYSAATHKTLLLWVGIFVYAIGTILWAFSLRHEYLSKAISVFSVLNLLTLIAVGVLFFKENLTFIDKIGIVLGVVSVILLQF